jgi:hypothetical protein
MRIIAAVIGAIGLAAAVAAAVPANAHSYRDGGYRHVRVQPTRVHHRHGQPRWSLVHYRSRDHHHYRYNAQPYGYYR